MRLINVVVTLTIEDTATLIDSGYSVLVPPDQEEELTIALRVRDINADIEKIDHNNLSRFTPVKDKESK